MLDILREISTWEESRYFTDSSLFYYINQMIGFMYIASHDPPLIRESQPRVCVDTSQFLTNIVSRRSVVNSNVNLILYVAMFLFLLYNC